MAKESHKIEILNSVYQFASQYGDSATSVRTIALIDSVSLICEGHVNKEKLKTCFNNLSDNEIDLIINLHNKYKDKQILEPKLEEKINLAIHEHIKNAWTKSIITTLKVLIPALILFIGVYYAGKKLIFPPKWTVSYFSNKNLSGVPYGTYEEYSPNHDWGIESPKSGMSPNNFSARFESNLIVSEPDTYTFEVTGDDGIRLFIDDELILDYWIPQDSVLRVGTKFLSNGSHKIRLEYFEAEAGAKLNFKARSIKSESVKLKLP